MKSGQLSRLPWMDGGAGYQFRIPRGYLTTLGRRTLHEPLPDLWTSLVRRPDHERAASNATHVTTALKLAGWEFRFPGMQITHSR